MGARLATALVPVFCGLLGVILSNLPITLFGGLVPAPLLGFIPIYFWCLVRPDLMTPAAAFARSDRESPCQRAECRSPSSFQ